MADGAPDDAKSSFWDIDHWSIWSATQPLAVATMTLEHRNLAALRGALVANCTAQTAASEGRSHEIEELSVLSIQRMSWCELDTLADRVPAFST
jgi:hypothetical protein